MGDGDGDSSGSGSFIQKLNDGTIKTFIKSYGDSYLTGGRLLVGTSANISGSDSFTNPDECKNLSGYDLFIDGGVISSKGESTIIEIQEDKIKIVRKGSVSEEEIKELD